MAFPEAMPRSKLGRPFRAWGMGWDGPRALPWATLGCAFGAFLLGAGRIRSGGSREGAKSGGGGIWDGACSDEGRVRSLAVPGLLGEGV